MPGGAVRRPATGRQSSAPFALVLARRARPTTPCAVRRWFGVKHQELRAIDDAIVAALAREADVDERTVIRRLAGLPVRGRAGRRIDRALQTLQIASRAASDPRSE